MSASADRNLLFGILAVQLDFISKNALITAMNAWLLDKRRSIGDILQAQGHLPTERLHLLTALVSEHFKHHGGDPRRSLAAVSLDVSAHQALESIADADMQQTLAQVGIVRTPSATPLGDAIATVAQPAQPAATAGRYRILRLHARGGLGEVFVALDTELDRQVALKEIQESHADDPNSRTRFVLEAEITGGLEHPGIVPVYGLGTRDNGRPYYAMRFVKGDTLRDAIGRFHTGRPATSRHFGSLSFRELLTRFISVCNAVAYAHSRGVIHRDLKPANVMLGRFGETLVVDWGLAKTTESTADRSTLSADASDSVLRPRSSAALTCTAEGHALGTPAYMSPEQACGQQDDLGPAADVYGLGAMLYEILCDRAPFTTVDWSAIRAGRFSPPRQMQPSVPRALEAICLKAMAFKSADRYESAIDVAADVERWLADEPVRVHQDAWHTRVRRWGRRHRALAATLASISAMAIVMSIMGNLLAVQISHEHAQAVAAGKLADQKAQDEEKARKVASEQRKFALETLYKTATTVEDKLRERPDMHRLREDIISIAMKGLENVSVTPENAAFADRSMGIALQRMGEVGLAVGKTKEAREQFEKTPKIFDHLMVTDPEEDWNRYNAAISLTHLGDISCSLGEPAEVARELYIKGLKLREELVAHPKKGGPQPPNGPLVRKQALAISYAKLGSRMVVAGDPAGGREYYVKALDLSRELAGAKPDELQFLQSLAGSCIILADVSFRLRDEAGARRYYDEAIKLREELAEKAPQSTRYQSDVASAYDALGDLHLHVNQPALALEHYQKVHVIHEMLAKKDPENVEMLSSLSTSFYRLGTARLYINDQAGADRDYQESLRIKEQLAKTDPSSAAHRAGIMLAQARLGRHAEAAQAALEIAEDGTKDPSMLFRAACGYALCIDGTVHGKSAGAITAADREQQKEYADASLAALAQAVELGYADVVALEMDPDLSSLHGYPSYQELLKKVRAKSGTK
jgi:serine/threonine-protein kinase